MISEITPMWGDALYEMASDLSEVPSIRGLTYRFLPKEIKHVAQYKTLLDGLVAKMMATVRSRKFSIVTEKRLCQRVANSVSTARHRSKCSYRSNRSCYSPWSQTRRPRSAIVSNVPLRLVEAVG